MFYQRDLLYSIYQVDTKLLGIKDSKIEAYQNLDSLSQHKADSLNKIISNQDIIAQDWKKLYKKQKNKNTGLQLGGVTLILGLGGFLIWQVVK